MPSNSLSSGSAPAPAYTFREDLEIVVRRTDRALVDPLRRNERELVRRVNRAISDAVNEGVIPSPITVLTGLVLPSGDV